MTLNEAASKVREIAADCGYEGILSVRAVNACAEVYRNSLGADGTPNGTGATYLRSGGGKSRLNGIQWLLTRTPAFKAWFGKSVVVDENGDPQVMFHGSGERIEAFDPSHIGVRKSKMTLWSGPGYYFTDSRRTAIIYGKEGGTVMSAFLKLENPLVVDETGNAERWGDHIPRREAEAVMLDGDNVQWLDVTLAGELARMDEQEARERGKNVAGARVMGKAAYRALSRAERVRAYVARLKTDVVKLKCITSAFGGKSQRKMMESICRHTGHDGVIHRIAPGVTEWVVYNPEAIKSATENDGTYRKRSVAVADDAKGTLGGGSGGAVGIVGHVGMDGADDEATVTVAETISITPESGDRTDKEKEHAMQFGALLDALKGMVRPSATGMDIVDRHGRHHQPKAIPEGGQYEEEGQYLTGAAKVEHAVRNAGSGKHADLLRRHVAPLYAKMGVDSATRAKIQKMHEDIRGMSKHQLLRKAAGTLKDMKRHAENYDAVKGMSKEQFAAWLQEHPEYNTAQVQKLMSEGRYGRHYGITGEEGSRSYHDDGTGRQKHEAWEEAKWSVGARCMASAMLFQEYSDAINGTPDQILANEIDRAVQDNPQEDIPGGEVHQEQIAAQSPHDQITAQNTQEARIPHTAAEREQALRDNFGSVLNPFLPNGGSPAPAPASASAPANEQQGETGTVQAGLPEMPSNTQIHDLAQRMFDQHDNPASFTVDDLETVLKNLANGVPPPLYLAIGTTINEVLDIYGREYGLHDDPTFMAIRSRAEAAARAERSEEIGQAENGTPTEQNTNPIPMNVTEEDYQNAVNTMVQHLGEGNRSHIEQAMRNFRQHGTITNEHVEALSSHLGDDNPVVREARRVAGERATEADRRRMRMANFAPDYPEHVKEAHRKIAADNGIRFSETPIPTTGRQGDGYNCYLTALVYSMRKAGLDIPYLSRPCGYGTSSQKYYVPMKQAMAAAGWDRVQGDTDEETVANLKRLAQTKPNGYTIECWGADHHGTTATLVDGKWMWSDVYRGNFNNELSEEELAHKIGSNRSRHLSSMDVGERRAMSLAVLKGLDPTRRREMTQQEKDAYVNQKLKEHMMVVESSYGHSPEQGFTDEMVKQALRMS